MPERLIDDPTLPPPGRRSGAGSASILPYLLNSLAARPTVPVLAEARAHRRDLPPPGASVSREPRR